MAEYPPFKAGASYNTPLAPLDEMAFRQWVLGNSVPFNVNAPVSDYDMRGYWRGVQQGNPMSRPTEINPNDNQPHYTDYYKTPLHQTFSAESQWAGPNAPTWINDHQLASPNGRIQFDEQAQVGPLGGLLGSLFR
jgi:hypothetical protein